MTSKGKVIGGKTLDQFFAEAGQILLDSGRVFRHGNSICLETGAAEERALIDLATDHQAEPGPPPCWRTCSSSGSAAGRARHPSP